MNEYFHITNSTKKANCKILYTTNSGRKSKAKNSKKIRSQSVVDVQVGGLERAFAISDILAITVLIPLPFPST